MSTLVFRSGREDILRRSWTTRPNPVLRAAAAAYGLASDARNLAWSVGVFRPARCSAPVISIGGLSIGGSGKTPITAAVARHLADAGLDVAVLTAGFADELAVHAAINPDIPSIGGRDRARLAEAAVQQGSTVLLLDSGFQHRGLHRDLDIVTLLVDYRGGTGRLPAGPFRERWGSIDRADAVLLVRRQSPPQESARLAREVRRAFPTVHVAHARVAPVGLEPVSDPAREISVPDPEVATAGIMWPEGFFRAVADLGLSPRHRVLLTDHAEIDGATVEAVVARAGVGGIVCTRKDASKLSAALPPELPLWSVTEQVAWEEGGSDLLRAAIRIAASGTQAAADAS